MGVRGWEDAWLCLRNATMSLLEVSENLKSFHLFWCLAQIGGGISVGTWDLKNMACAAAPWAGKQELKHIYFVFQMFNPEVRSPQPALRNSKVLQETKASWGGSNTTEGFGLWAEVCCQLPAISSAGLDGEGESKGAFTGEKHPSQQWQGAELVGCLPVWGLAAILTGSSTESSPVTR